MYREEFSRNHPERPAGTVTLMLHTFIGKDGNGVEKIVRPPLREYI